MILLVRCRDNTCSVALKSHLDDLINEGLVTAFLRNGEWITAEKTRTMRECASSKQPKVKHAPPAAPF